MIAKHSPEPWKVLQHYSQGIYDGQIIVDAEGWNVCNLWHNNHTDDKPLIERCEANGQLIGAAPDLLSFVIEYLWAEHGEIMEGHEASCLSKEQLQDKARTVIAKATRKKNNHF